MWTTILAIYAAVVSTGSLMVAYLSYKSGGPRLTGKSRIFKSSTSDEPSLSVRLYNRGQAPISILSMRLYGASQDEWPIDGWRLKSDDYQFPARIEGHSGELWTYPAGRLVKKIQQRPDIEWVYVSVRLGNGKYMSIDVDTSRSQLVGRKDPRRQLDRQTDTAQTENAD